MTTKSAGFMCVEIFLFIFGLLVPLWPLIALAIALAVWRGDWIVAFVLALLTDLLFGMPTRRLLHTIPIPFTLLTLVAVVLRAALVTQMRRSIPNIL